MAEIRFYQLDRQPLESVLPSMLTKALERQWRSVVQAGSAERSEALAALLWTGSDESFIPHGTRADGFAELQPIWLTDDDDNPNSATVRFYVDGAMPGDALAPQLTVIVFDGADGDAVSGARDAWKRFKAAGHQVTFWKQEDDGRWVNQAS